ncbi:MAG: 30S ribosomal protein S7 [Patescibacteria group bacterium]
MRAKKNYIRTIVPDSKYNSPIVAKMINAVMLEGKKTVAAREVYGALSLIKEQAKTDELTYLTEALENVKPQMEVRSRRVGGASYQVPTPVRNERKQTLAIRWLVAAARDRSNSSYHSFAAKLAAEIIDAHAEIGNAIKKKLDTHRMADANRAFAHFRW